MTLKKILATIGLVICLGLTVPAVAQEEKVETGTDPRDFAPKFMPYYRFTELENGLENHSLTLFGLHAFKPNFAMTYEIPLGYKNDVSGTALNNGDDTCGPLGSFPPGPGLPPIQIPGVQGNCQETGMGDMNLRFMWSNKNWSFAGGDVLWALQVDLPTATQNFLGTEQVRLGPAFIWVKDIPIWPGPGAFAALMNFYFFDVFGEDDVGDTSMYVGRWFTMLPLSKPGPGLFDGLFILAEFQPIYDFENSHFSFWVGPEIGKVITKKNIFYMKPGWGADPDFLQGDRKFTFEIGWRYFMD